LSRRAVPPDVGEFIAARSDSLLRTAFLLNGDRERAEDNLQQALSRVWSGWSRDELGPDLAARRELVRGMDPWWRRRSPPEDDELLAALNRLSRRQRAALVLSEMDGLSVAELAEVLECPETIARRLTARARDAIGDPGLLAALQTVTVADEPVPTRGTTVAQRLGHVERRVGVRRRRRRIETIASLAVASVAAIVVGVALSPSDNNDQTPPPPDRNQVAPPPVIVGHQLPPILHITDVNYVYAQSAVSHAGDSRLRVVVAPRDLSQAVTWVTPWTLKGVVEVRVDGDLVTRAHPGPLGEGVLLTSRQRHVVVLTATKPLPGARLGVAIYHFPRL
jgi:DNA-directed RNA polymerase specialized sigma24 family protein